MSDERGGDRDAIIAPMILAFVTKINRGDQAIRAMVVLKPLSCFRLDGKTVLYWAGVSECVVVVVVVCPGGGIGAIGGVGAVVVVSWVVVVVVAGSSGPQADRAAVDASMPRPAASLSVRLKVLMVFSC